MTSFRVFPLCVATLCVVQLEFHSSAFGQIERGRFVNPGPVPGMDSPFREQYPFVTADGLTILFGSDREFSDRPVDFSQMDIWSATRSSTDEPFGNHQKLPSPINRDDVGDGSPFLSQDGLRLYYNTDTNSFGSEIVMVERKSIEDPWSDPVGQIERDDEEIVEFGHSLSSDELTIYFSSTRESEQHDPSEADIFVATRSSRNEQFSSVELLEEISTNEFAEKNVSVSSNGLVMFYDTPRDGIGFEEIWVATRQSTSDPFENPMNVNRLGLGSGINNGDTAEATPFISADWPAPGSKLYYLRAKVEPDWDIWEATWRVKDFVDTNLDGMAGVDDIDALHAAIRIDSQDSVFDLNEDSKIDNGDVQLLLERLGTVVGDSNFDGTFGTSDFVFVFQAGQYEDGEVENSGWATGDWNGDREFNSSDFVLAFQAGTFQGAARIAETVPEPSSSAVVCLFGLTWCLRYVRRSTTF